MLGNPDPILPHVEPPVGLFLVVVLVGGGVHTIPTTKPAIFYISDSEDFYPQAERWVMAQGYAPGPA